MPFGSSITTVTSSAPIQKYQYCGADARELIARDHEDDGADETAIEPAGAAEDQDDHTSAERWKSSTPSETVSVVCASRAPAMPAITAEIV